MTDVLVSARSATKSYDLGKRSLTVLRGRARLTITVEVRALQAQVGVVLVAAHLPE